MRISSTFMPNRRFHIELLLFSMAIYSIDTITSFSDSFFVTILFSILASAVYFIRRIHYSAHAIKLYACILFCVFLIVISGITSVEVGYYRDFTFYIIGLIYVTVIAHQDDFNYMAVIRIMVIAAAVFTFGVFFQYLFPDIYNTTIYPLFSLKYQRIIRRQFYRNKMCTGFSSQTVVSAQYIIMGLYLLFCSRNGLRSIRAKVFTYTSMLMMLIGVILTGKRSSILLLLICLIYVEIVVTRPGRRVLYTARGLIVALALFLFFYYFIAPNLTESRNAIVRLMEYAEDRELDISNGRFAMYRNAIDAFWESPVFGKGWWWFHNTYNTHTHNIYLQLLCEVGIVGTGPICAVMLAMFFKTNKYAKKYAAGMSVQRQLLMKFSLFSQLFFLIYGLVGNPLYNYSFLFWYLFAIAVVPKVTNKQD